LIDQYAQKRAELKAKVKDSNLTLLERFKYMQKLDSLPSDSSKVRYRKRCALTGRARGKVHKSLGISRIMLRELVAKGQVAGIRKASW
jgi:small subunit ribosomal protein S14